ncbi:MAG: hypothetical protein PHN75_20165 [Syntrophales bacterium]|nr:hypothetical protein [Syntrophales bacterium]
MDDNKMGKYAAGFGISLIITSLLNAVILIVKETTPAVMGRVKSNTEEQ